MAVVGFDIILNEPDTDDPDGEVLLAAAIARHGRVVLPVIPSPTGAAQVGAGRPLAAFAGAAAALGHIEMPIDADGIICGLFLRARRWRDDASATGAGDAVARRPRTRARYPPTPHRGGVLGPRQWRRDGWRYLRFAGPPGSYRTVSYAWTCSPARSASTSCVARWSLSAPPPPDSAISTPRPCRPPVSRWPGPRSTPTR
ncbi:MAG: CHASE2 domain-containing protein [Rhodocyclaceae bacterium]|nr:CHASE2 domain-containing protein [Rhodocyclaceae bacterium]